MSASIRITRTRPQPFTVVQPEIYERRELSLAARHVLGWMLGRSDDFVIGVSYLCRYHGLSEKIWVRIRNELQAQGFFVSTRRRMPNGKFEWENLVTDEPLYVTQPDSVPRCPAPSPEPEQASLRAQFSLEDFLLPPTLEGYRPTICRAAQAAGLTAAQTQQLADEFVGRLRETSAPRINLPARWLSRAATAILAGETSRWAKVGAADRHVRAAVPPAAPESPTRRLPREERDAMMRRAINQDSGIEGDHK